MTEMIFSDPYTDRHPFPDPIRGYEISNMMIGLFKMETYHPNSLCIDVSFYVKAFSSFYAC